MIFIHYRSQLIFGNSHEGKVMKDFQNEVLSTLILQNTVLDTGNKLACFTSFNFIKIWCYCKCRGLSTCRMVHI